MSQKQKDLDLKVASCGHFRDIVLETDVPGTLEYTYQL